MKINKTFFVAGIVLIYLIQLAIILLTIVYISWFIGMVAYILGYFDNWFQGCCKEQFKILNEVNRQLKGGSNG